MLVELYAPTSHDMIYQYPKLLHRRRNHGGPRGLAPPFIFLQYLHERQSNVSVPQSYYVVFPCCQQRYASSKHNHCTFGNATRGLSVLCTLHIMPRNNGTNSDKTATVQIQPDCTAHAVRLRYGNVLLTQQLLLNLVTILRPPMHLQSSPFPLSKHLTRLSSIRHQY